LRGGGAVGKGSVTTFSLEMAPMWSLAFATAVQGLMCLATIPGTNQSTPRKL
jgi:hypothetical protein